MIVTINIARYVVSIIVLILTLSNAYVCFLACIIILIINNIVDDILFYKSNLDINIKKYDGGIISPVNGIVTCIEKNVELYNKIEKSDCLINDIYHRPKVKAEEVLCNHVTIFLNKFNKHLFVNPSKLKKIQKHYKTGELEEMVIDGQLVADNKGTYLNNDCVLLEYETCNAVLTLDKYISEYIYIGPDDKKGGILICKGSQCDIYLPVDMEIVCKIGDVVDINETIAKGEKERCEFITKKEILSIIDAGILFNGGYNAIIYKNIKKSLSTFKNLSISTTSVIGVMLSIVHPTCMYIAVAALFLFVIDRSYKNLLYSIMNKIGLKKWMQKSYYYLHKISIIWKMK